VRNNSDIEKKDDNEEFDIDPEVENLFG